MARRRDDPGGPANGSPAGPLAHARVSNKRQVVKPPLETCPGAPAGAVRRTERADVCTDVRCDGAGAAHPWAMAVGRALGGPELSQRRRRLDPGQDARIDELADLLGR